MMLKRLAKFSKHSKGVLVLSLVLSVFLYGCSAEKSEPIVLNIPDVDDYTFLLVQGIAENGVAASNDELIRDDKKIKELISKVNHVEVIKPPNDERMEKNLELNGLGNYMVLLANSSEMDDKVYAMGIFKDGAMTFQHPEKNELTYISKEKNTERLEEIKKLLDITY